MLFGSSPIYNAILFYILFVIIILVIKPNSMYDHKTKKFKSFGCGEKQTLFAFPIVALSSAVIFYIIFLVGSILSEYLE
jgi:hypothetical protein